MWFNQKYKNPWVRILAHTGFWLVYLMINALTTLRYYPDRSIFNLALQILLTLPVDMCATYLTVYLLFPAFLYKRKYLLFAITFIGSALLFILLQRVIIYTLTYPLFFPGRQPQYPFSEINWVYSFTNIYLVVAAVSVIKLFKISMVQQERARDLIQKKTEAELNFLKAQVHPHFLFNTLNNLYALTLDKSDKAPEIVLKLSSLLNYMLYECNEPFTLLSKEIGLLEDYLSLERIRYGDQLDLHFSVTGEVAGKRLAPMLLLPFVENAFKHGVSRVGKNPSVNIIINSIENQLEFSVTNSRSVYPGDDLAGYSKGIGLGNVQKRLELQYPSRHKLEIHETDHNFSIHLRLNLGGKNDSEMPVGR